MSSGAPQLRYPRGAVELSRQAAGFGARRLGPAAAFGALSVACGIGLLACSGWLITRASERPPVFVLSFAIGGVQAFALGRGLARYFQRLSAHDLSLAALARLRLRLYDDLEPLVPGGLRECGSGVVLGGFVADAELVADGAIKTVTVRVDLAASILVGAGLACLIQPVLAGILALGAVSAVLSAVALGGLGRQAATRELETRGQLADSVVETVRSTRELVAHGRQDLIQQRLEATRRRSRSAAVRTGLATGLGRAAVAWVSGATLVAVIWRALSIREAGRLSGVMLAVVVFVTLAVLDQCAALPTVLADGAAADAAARRLVELGRATRPAPEPAQDRSPRAGPVTARLERVGLGLRGPGAQGLSLELPPGRRVALVGPSGSGKTSVLHALLHFIECVSGRTSIGGVDVREMSRTGVAKHVGWMTDDTHVFAATLRDNLRLARPSAADSECEEALGRAGLEAWCRSLPDGLDSQLGAGGRGLSAGERQRLGLARSLLARGTLMLLDEPTAHIDPYSSGSLLAELIDAAGGRSVLVVSHDPDVVGHVDQVVTLGRPGQSSVDEATRSDEG